MKQLTPRPRDAKSIKQRRKPKIDKREEDVLRLATLHLLTKHGMFLVATDAREVIVKGLKLWIISVTLRYTTGHEGYVGELLYDGEAFTFLTPVEIRRARIGQIASDPEREQKWNERAAAL